MALDKNFTVAKGIEVQQEQLERWKSVLKPEVFKSLNDYVTKVNKQLDPSKHNGYDVPRGTCLDNLIANYMLGHKFGGKNNSIIIF